MPDYITTQVSYTGDGAFYACIIKQALAVGFTEVAHHGNQVTTQTDCSGFSLAKGDYTVLQSPTAWSDGKYWQFLIGRGDAAIGGYSSPGSGILVTASPDGTWDSGTEKFDGDESAFIRIDDGVGSSQSWSGYVMAFDYTDVATGQALQGVVFWERTGTYSSRGGVMVGVLQTFGGADHYPKPLYLHGTRMDPDYEGIQKVYSPAGVWNTASNYRRDAMYSKGTDAGTGFPVLLPYIVFDDGDKRVAGIFPLIMRGDETLNDIETNDHTYRIVEKGYGWPI